MPAVDCVEWWSLSGMGPTLGDGRGLRIAEAQDGREGAQLLQVGAVGAVAERVNGDMVGSCVQMGPDAAGDRFLVSGGDEGVDEVVAAAIGEVVISESHGFEVADVVGQSQSGGDVAAGCAPGPLPVAADDDRLLGNEQWAGPQGGPGGSGVLGG
ncbi:hypothetical protein GCM10020295_81540 [Streptomyces cinereospinus]